MKYVLNSPLLRKTYSIFLLLFGIMSLGTFGYMFLEGYTFVDALYMTVQTVSTVGFNEVKPFTGYGKEFTVLLIMSSFGTFAYGVTIITKFAADGTFREFFDIYRVQKQINHLENHVLICGFGRNGRQAAKKLIAYGKDIVVVEKSEELIKRFKEEFPGVLYLVGDATDDELLLRAGIKKASQFIATVHEDADNLFLVISARQLNPSIKIVSRANEPSSEKKIRIAGADYVIQPNIVGGTHMAEMVMHPDVTEFLDRISVDGNSDMNLEEVSIESLSEEGNIKISDLEIRKQTGCTIIGVKTSSGDFIINPYAEMHLSSKSKMFVLGNQAQIQKLKNYLNNNENPSNR